MNVKPCSCSAAVRSLSSAGGALAKDSRYSGDLIPSAFRVLSWLPMGCGRLTRNCHKVTSLVAVEEVAGKVRVCAGTIPEGLHEDVDTCALGNGVS